MPRAVVRAGRRRKEVRVVVVVRREVNIVGVGGGLGGLGEVLA